MSGFFEGMPAGLQAGMTLGGANVGDVARVVERLLFRQWAQGVILRVMRPVHDECGHLDITIVELVPAVD